MFGSDMFGKMEAMKRMAEESKSRLDAIIVEGEAGNGLVVVELTGNRAVRSVKINGDHTIMEKEDLEDLIAVALQRAVDQANAINEQEVMSSAKHLFPGM
ncbi:MAG: YbaB/EbfC family nucleoid-associated protein [Flavobacteriia bacterium]|jgi:DNA-binding YbaB/EbfC family protein